MKRNCSNCDQAIARGKWILANLFKWHIYCPLCKYRYTVIDQKPWAEKLEALGAVATGFFLFKFFGNLMLAAVIAFFVKTFPALEEFWKSYMKAIIPIGLGLGMIIFRFTFLHFIYGVKKIK